MKFRSTLICFLAISMALWGMAFGADKIIYSQNFDGLDDGAMDGQDGWVAAMGQATTTVQSNVALSGKAMMVEAFQEVSIIWPEPVESGTCYLSIFFNKEDADAGNTLHIYMGKGVQAWAAGTVIRIGSQSGGAIDDIGVHNGDPVEPVAKYVPQQWHHIREVIDVDNLTFTVYLDGKDVGKFDFRNPAAHDAIEWLFIGFDGGAEVLGYYDAIEFGLGKGEQAFQRATPVESAGKLGITWGTVKAGY